VPQIRFWGKVLGRSGDYFVAEALTESTSAPDPMEANEEVRSSALLTSPALQLAEAAERRARLQP